MDNEWQWQQENAKLRHALDYYANAKNYNPVYGSSSGRWVCRVEQDRGKKARKVLEELANGSS